MTWGALWARLPQGESVGDPNSAVAAWTPRVRAPWLREAMRAGEPFHARHQVPWRHNLVNLLCTAGVLAGLAGLAWVAPLLPWFVYLPLASVLGGCLFFALFIQVVHEASHEMYLLAGDASTTRTWNRRVGRLVTMLLFTNWEQHWQEGHVVHHLRPMEADDPQVGQGAAHGRPLYGLWLKLLTIPLYVFRANPSGGYGIDPVRFGGALLTWGLVLGALAITWSWTLPLAFLGAFHTTMALSLLRENQEHAAHLEREEDPACRSRTYFYPLWRLFIPFNMNYHLEHHLNFKVPWYRLPAYHREVRRLMPEALHPYFFTTSLGPFLQQVAGSRSRVPDELRHLLRTDLGSGPIASRTAS